jgi:hypothetical protein
LAALPATLRLKRIDCEDYRQSHRGGARDSDSWRFAAPCEERRRDRSQARTRKKLVADDAVAEIDRSLVKLWMTVSFGNSNPATRWPPKTIKDFKKETGKDLSKVAKAKDIAQRMLESFPALKKLENTSEAWAHLQYREGQAVMGTMLVLMREHGIPSLSMYDGIIVPKSQAELAKATLKQVFKEVVGVEPILTVETAPEPTLLATDL